MPTNERGEFECPSCDHMSPTRAGLGSHHSAAHGHTLLEAEQLEKYDGEWHDCPWDGCEERFPSKVGLKLHYSKMDSHEGSLSKTQLVCESCGGDFEVYERREDTARFCSYECSRDRVQWSCEWCGKTEMLVPSHAEDRAYCSDECHYNGMSERYSGKGHPRYNRVTLFCERCGSEYQSVRSKAGRSRFCSMACLGDWVSEYRSAEDIQKVCEVCGDRFTVRDNGNARRFCSSSCTAEWRSEWMTARMTGLTGDDHPAWRGGCFPYGSGWTEKKKESVREDQGRRCLGCSKHESEQNRRLSVHHITKARSLLDAPAEVRNGEDNLVALCDECHPDWEQMSPLRPQIPQADD